ncbi:MAG: hypothetical protein KDD92_16185 [Caldilineaceae bacterium]|nr:hypothetical protein [Caldilineaceae bacterium]
MKRRLLSVSSGLILIALLTLFATVVFNRSGPSVATLQSPLPPEAIANQDGVCQAVSRGGFTFSFYGYADYGQSIGLLAYGVRNDNKKDISYVAFGIADHWEPVGPLWDPYATELGEYGHEWTNDKGRPGFRSLKLETQFDGFSSGAEDIFIVTVSNFDVNPTQTLQLQAKAGNQTETVTIDLSDPDCLRSVSEMPRDFERKISRFLSPLPTPTPHICAEPQDWLTYSDPVVGITLSYPPEGNLSVTPRYDLPPEERTGAIFTARTAIRPACEGYNPDCYETMGFGLGVHENLNGLSLEGYLLDIYAGNLNLTEADLYQYGEAVVIDGYPGIRFNYHPSPPEWLTRIVGHPTVPTTPVTFIAHGAYITKIIMGPIVRAPVDSVYRPACEQAVQIYDEMLSGIQINGQ